MNWKTERVWKGAVMAIRNGDYVVDKQPIDGEDQYYVTKGEKLIGVCNEASTAKRMVEELHENGDGV